MQYHKGDTAFHKGLSSCSFVSPSCTLWYSISNPYLSSTSSMPGIFENSVSKVRIGRLYCNPVAAMSTSAKRIFFFCLRSIAISFIPSLNERIRQSCKSALHGSNWPAVIPGLPNSSISLTNETASSFPEYGISRWSPSSKLMRMLVSARNSARTTHFVLVRHSIQAPFKSPKMFLERRLFLAFPSFR